MNVMATKNLKKLSLTGLIIMLFLANISCNSPNNKILNVTVREFNLIYTKPILVSNLDSTTKFNSKVFFGLGVVFKNNSNELVKAKLNDLRIDDSTFDLIALTDNNSFRFYNYPFSSSSFPYNNKLSLEPNSSSYIKFESPYYYSFKECNLKQVDSLLNLIKHSLAIKIIQKTKNDISYIIDTKKMEVNATAMNY